MTTDPRPHADPDNASRAEPGPTRPVHQVEVFFDNNCPLCRREINMLRWLDRRQRIVFTDITANDFDQANFGMTMDDFMDEIQGRLPNGTLITGVEVFRRLYGAVGFWWLIPFTRIPGISHGLDFGYRFFAKNRLRMTGRCDQSCPIEPAATPDESSKRRHQG